MFSRQIAALMAAAVVVNLAGSGRAAAFVEVGDAGRTLLTASNTGLVSGTALTSITGTIGAGTDADLYRIQITGTSFSASTNNAYTQATLGGIDTALFLFDSVGHAVLTNDDAAGGQVVQSTLTATGLTAGTYFLGISLSGNEPINSASQLLFAGYPGGDTTAIRGPASGLNPTTLSDFDNNGYSVAPYDAGPYQIDLTGVASVNTPEPSVLLVSCGSASVLVGRRRSLRRNSQ